jgi:hypothetical protein
MGRILRPGEHVCLLLRMVSRVARYYDNKDEEANTEPSRSGH